MAEDDGMSAEEFRAIAAAGSTGPSVWQMTEEQLEAEILALCEEREITWAHIDTPHHNRKRHNLAGFPDLMLFGRGGSMFRELKRQRNPGGSPAQTNWKYWLLAAGQDYAIWQPRDLESGRIKRELDRLAGRPA